MFKISEIYCNKYSFWYPGCINLRPEKYERRLTLKFELLRRKVQLFSFPVDETYYAVTAQHEFARWNGDENS